MTDRIDEFIEVLRRSSHRRYTVYHDRLDAETDLITLAEANGLLVEAKIVGRPALLWRWKVKDGELLAQLTRADGTKSLWEDTVPTDRVWSGHDDNP